MDYHAAQPSSILASVKVFYIEDDKTNQYIVGKIIELSGGAIQFNTSGFPETIIPRLRIFRPHIILMDLMLAGGINGFDTARAIHRIGILSRIPIVAVSSSDTAIEIPKARQSGMRGFIPKPVDSQTFPGYIRRILDGETLWLG